MRENADIKDLNAWRILMNFLCIYLGEGRGGYTDACICMGTHSQPLLQNRLMDVYKTWQGWSNHGPAHAYKLFGQIRPEVEPRRRKNRSMRGPFSKRLLLQIGMQQQQTECILVSWIEISWLFAVHTDFTNLTVMLSNLLRNLTFNRSAHCTQVSDRAPWGSCFNHHSARKVGKAAAKSQCIKWPKIINIFVIKIPNYRDNTSKIHQWVMLKLKSKEMRLDL